MLSYTVLVYLLDMNFILWTTKESTEETVPFEYMGRRSWKNTLEFDFDWDGWELCWGKHLRHETAEDPQAWRSLPSGWIFSFKWKVWGLGYDCFYYDGTHHDFSVGPFHFYWFGWPHRCSCEED